MTTPQLPLGLEAMASLIVSFRKVERQGLGRVVTDCEWTAEHAIEGAKAAISGAVDVQGSKEIPLSSRVAAIAVKNVGDGPLRVQCGAWLDVTLQRGGAVTVSSPEPNDLASAIVLTGTTQAELVAVTQ